LPKIDWSRLTDEERLQLLDEAWESFVRVPDSLPLTTTQLEEIERRAVAYERGETTTEAWDVVREKIERRYGHRP
jgi:putative addiction module component (TIGR02574 family)